MAPSSMPYVPNWEIVPWGHRLVLRHQQPTPLPLAPAVFLVPARHHPVGLVSSSLRAFDNAGPIAKWDRPMKAALK